MKIGVFDQPSNRKTNLYNSKTVKLITSQTHSSWIFIPIQTIHTYSQLGVFGKYKIMLSNYENELRWHFLIPKCVSRHQLYVRPIPKQITIMSHSTIYILYMFSKWDFIKLNDYYGSQHTHVQIKITFIVIVECGANSIVWTTYTTLLL